MFSGSATTAISRPRSSTGCSAPHHGRVFSAAERGSDPRSAWSAGGGDGEPACKPDSVGSLAGAAPVAIHLCGLPGDIGRASRPTLGLAPGGGCQPPGSPPTLVRSYRTVSPLPVRAAGSPAFRHRRSALCCPEPAGRPVLALASTLALWSPDFPRRLSAPRPPGRLTVRNRLPGHADLVGADTHARRVIAHQNESSSIEADAA